MKYLKRYENHEDIRIICQKCGIKNYTINADGSIDVDGDVDLSYRKLEKLPLKFGNVGDYFYCNNNRLTSLEGCPKSVGGDFSCHDNNIETFEGLDFVYSL